VNIIDFIRDRNLIGQKLSIAQTAALKAFYGLELNRRELEVYKRCTGLEEYHARAYPEVDFICGRRSGKTDRLASNIVLFEVFEGGHEKRLNLGERGMLIVLSVNQRQAQIVLNYIKGKVDASPILRSMVADVYNEEIRFKNGLSVASYPCSFRGLRGYSVPVCVIDELAFFKVQGVNVDREVLEAVRPAQATFPGAKLVKISSPYAKQGELWRDFASYYGKNQSQVLIWKAPSKVMNPTISDSFLRREKRRDPDAYRREYEAEFSDSISDFIPADAIDSCVVVGRRGVPPRPDFNTYVAAIDAAFVSDRFAFCVCHSERGKVVFDYIDGWRGTKAEPLNMGATLNEISRVLHDYGCNLVWGDQFAAVPIREGLRDRGVLFMEYPFTTGSKQKLYTTLKTLILEGATELLDHADSVRELKSLEATITPSGTVRIGAPRISGASDDFATVIALSAFQCESTTSLFSGLSGANIFKFGKREDHDDGRSST